MNEIRFNSSHRCPGCKRHSSVLVTREQLKAFDMHLGWPLTNADPACGLVKDPAGGVGVACVGCGRRLYAKRVVGKLRPEKKCDARCLSATGHSCECACGGKNHGAAHS